MSIFLKSIIPEDARIIEIGPRDSKLARFFLRHGWKRYLGLITDEFPQSEVVETETSGDTPDFYPYSELPHDPYQIRKNNADVLVLSHDFVRYVWRSSLYQHAQYVVWSPGLRLSSAIGFAGMLKVLLLRRVSLAGVGRLELDSDSNAFFFVLKVEERRPRGRRLYISPFLERVFRSLQEHRVNYLVLRWFEDFPMKNPRKDIDVLVADDEVNDFERLSQEFPGIIECEIYSVSGLPGTNYNGDPHFPPPMAEKMLERAVWWKECYRVPCPEDYFFGLAYHALYHKGERSGIPSTVQEFQPNPTAPSHDYAAVLHRMADSLDIDVEITMEGLDQYMKDRGLRPNLDTLTRLSRTNAWVRQHVLTEFAKHNGKYRGLCNFYVRQRAIELGCQNEVTTLLQAEGFHIVEEIMLTREESEFLAGSIRGGNWSRGPYPTSGGKPAMLIVVFDPAPTAPSERTLAVHPTMENERIVLAKKRIRQHLRDRLPPSEHCNMLHSCDNGVEAVACLRALLSDNVDSLLGKAEGLKRLYGESNDSRGESSTRRINEALLR